MIIHDGGGRAGERGTAFVVVTIFAICTTVLVGAFFVSSLARVRDVELKADETAAFNVAEAGLSAIVEEVWARYRVVAAGDRIGRLSPLDGSVDPADRLILADRRIGGGRFDARVAKVNAVAHEYADVEFVSRGVCDGAVVVVRAVVRFGYRPAEVFDYAYFINNFGWLYGAGLTVNGSVRSNGNFDCANATVNGNVWACENEDLGAEGTITGDLRHDPLDGYTTHAPPSARPTDPSAVPEDADGDGEMDPGEDRNGNGVLDSHSYPEGYDGDPQWQERRARLDMPYLGDLEDYRGLARARGGRISQGGAVLVDGVLGDEAGEPRNVVLVGTAANPLVIDGPVVVESDVVIKGVITGKGSIYAGRNVHIVGNITYAHAPSWPKPMADAEGVRAANAGADLVAFAAKGSVVVGNYTSAAWKSVTRNYQRPPFTQPYVVDPTDAVNGYVSYYDVRGRPTFHGDYTAYDGGRKGVDTGSLLQRRYYESSFSDAFVASLCDSAIRQIDGIIYTNHLLSGKLDVSTINGALISRDEALIYNGSMSINYDVRAMHGGYEFLDIILPREPCRTVLFFTQGGR